MTISATRFSVLDKETNVAIASVRQLASDSTLNNPINDLKEADQAVKDLLATGQQSIGDIRDQLKDNLTAVTDEIPTDIVRKAKDAYSQVRDVSKLGNKLVEKAIAQVIPDNKVLQSAFGSLSSKCKTSALSRGQFGKPYDPSMSCNGSKRTPNNSSCNSNSFSNILDKLTGGAYSSSYSDANNTLNGLMALANLGYSMNMCGVLGALVSGGGITDLNLVSRAGAGLIGILSASGNANGVFDLAKFTASTPGVNFVREMPGAIGGFMSNFKIPDGFSDVNKPELYELINSSTNELDANWDTVGYDDEAIRTLASMDEVPNDLTEVMEVGVAKDFDLDGLPTDDGFVLNTAMVGTDFDFIGNDVSIFDYNL